MMGPSIYNIQSRRRAGGTGFLAPKTTLSVSWMGKQFRALAVQRGEVQGAWTSPDPVDGTHNFSGLIEKAVAACGYSGATVSLVLGHPRLAHQYLDVPPAKGAGLQKLLERMAQQQARSLFPSKAAWSVQAAESMKGTPRYLFNLFPKPLLDELVEGARKAGLFLTAVLPPTAVLQNQLLELPSGDTQVVMLAADTGGSTTLLVGRSDGSLLLTRGLASTWRGDRAALALDLRRTMLFVNQQHGVNVEGLFLFGAGAAECIEPLGTDVGLPTRLSPTEYCDDYWATEALRLQASLAQNLISPEQQQAPQRRRIAWVVTIATALLVASSAIVSARLHLLRRSERQSLATLRTQLADLQVRHRQLQEHHAELARQRNLVDVVAVKRAPPVPTWMFGYLSEAVPRELVVTNLVVRKEHDVWRLQLSGTVQPGGPTSSAESLARAVSILTNRLANGPFHVQFPDASSPTPAGESKTNTTPAPLSAWLGKLGPIARPQPTTDQGFLLEGVMQP